MPKNIGWKLIERKKVFSSKFVNVYEDKVELPDKSIIDDFTVIEKPDIVMIVATDSNNEVVILNEYKHASGKTLLTLPAGHKRKNEQPTDAAKRELFEETGFTGKDFEELGIIYDYPSKDLHKVYVVRAKNVSWKNNTKHEETEIINYQLIKPNNLKKQIEDKKWKTSSAIAALTLSGILF